MAKCAKFVFKVLLQGLNIYSDCDTNDIGMDNVLALIIKSSIGLIRIIMVNLFIKSCEDTLYIVQSYVASYGEQKLP